MNTGAIKRLGMYTMALVIVGAMMPAASAQAVINPLQIGILSDPHLFSAAQAGYYNSAFMKANEVRAGSLWMESEGMLESALAAFAQKAKTTGMQYLLIPGDLTLDGELKGHKALAKRLERFEKETGIRVAVIPGNHDINNTDGFDFSSGKQKPAEMTSPAQFREIYENLGYDLPNMEQFQPKNGKLGGGLSYAADLDGGYRLIAIDSCKYSKDQSEKGDFKSTGGMIGKDLLRWIKAQIKAAIAAGKVPVGMIHHSLRLHHGLQKLTSGFLIDDAKHLCEALAGAGLRFVFSGHIHTSEIADYKAGNGAVLYDVATSSLADLDPTIREVAFEASSPKDVTVQIKTSPADCVKSVTVNGRRQESPIGKASFEAMYHGDVRRFVGMAVDKYIGRTFDAVREAGGLQQYLKQRSADKKSLADAAILEGLFRELDRQYIAQPERLIEIVNGALQQILALEVSVLRSTRFQKSYDVGSSGPGTLGDLLNEALIYNFAREGSAVNNPFVQDAIKGIRQGDVVKKITGILMDTIEHDLLRVELPDLSRITAPAARLMSRTLGAVLGNMLSGLFSEVNGVPDSDVTLYSGKARQEVAA